MDYNINSWQEVKELAYKIEFEIGDKIIFENCQILVDEKPHTRVWQYVGKNNDGQKCFSQIKYETTKYQPVPPQFIDIEELLENEKQRSRGC